MSEAAGGSEARTALAFSGLAFGFAMTAAIVLKIVPLFTSQSMADGDEAVEGLMAMHILRDGVHPIYPYGVHYGAGAGLEAHLAAVFFALVGPSSVALKTVAFCIWLVSGGLVRAIAAEQWGRSSGWLALVVWSFAPFGAEWSLKVAGGHNVSVMLVLVAMWLGVRHDGTNRRRYGAVCVLALATIAHPVAMPVALGVAAALLLRAPSRERVGVAVALAVVSGLALVFLWSGGNGVWDPASRGLEPVAIGRVLPHVASGLFTANLNARELPDLFDGALASIWALAVLVSLAAVFAARRPSAGRSDLCRSSVCCWHDG